MKIAVAGGTGFIGRHAVAALVDAGHSVVVLARSADPQRNTDAIEHRALDLGAATPPGDALAGCDAVVNLVGIKTPRGTNDFAAAHLRTVDHLVAAATAAGIERFVHISVAQAEGARGPYAETKHEGEQRVRDCDRAWTILRPGLVYGDGDEPLRNVINMVTAAPVVPLPANATGPLPAIDVRDVALAIVATVERPATIGMSIDLVGPEVLTLRDLVGRTAQALDLPTVVPPVPAALTRAAAAAMDRLLPDPLLTPSQLGMLTAGLPGDPEHARQHLGIEPRPLSAERIRQLAAALDRPWPSVRLLPTAAHRTALADAVADLRRWPLVAALGLLLLLAGPWLIDTVWTRMAAINATLIAAVAVVARPALRPLLRPRPAHLAVGLLAALGLYFAADLGVALMRSAMPAWAAQIEEVYGWSDQASLGVRLGLLPLIVLGEDLAWRGVITLPLAHRLGPVRGCLLAAGLFALAHLTTGPPVLWFAAAAMGAVWSAMAIRSASVVPVFICHLAWDVAVMFVRPL